MILYFADRHFNILGTASTQLPGGLVVVDDVKAGDVESGVDVFECKVAYDSATKESVEACLEVGNFILRKHEDEEELYTIIDAEIDRKKQTVYIYAEDAGLDLINEIVSEYEADKEYPIDHYFTKFAYDSGFVIGINEAEGLTRKLTFDNEETVTARLAKVAAAFDNCEIAYRFIIEGLRCVGKVINIYKKRGQDLGVTLRLNKEIDNIVIKKTIANIATALRATGATPQDKDDPITLRGYVYDDGDFYVDGDALKSREALKRWSRYINPDEPNQKDGHEGHIVRLFDYDTVDQDRLCAETLKELKRVREAEVNYEAEILSLPQNVKIGDRVNIVDEAGKLFLSSRLLQLERSVVNDEHKAVLGEHLLKGSGISAKVQELAEKHAQNAQKIEKVANETVKAALDAKTAYDTAGSAKDLAQHANGQAELAVQGAQQAKTTADNAKTAADTAKSAADKASEDVSVIKNKAVFDVAINGQYSQQICVENAIENSIDNIKLFGKTQQSTTPMPTAPVTLESTGANGNVALAVEGVNLLDIDSCLFRECTYSNGVITSNFSSSHYATIINQNLSSLLMASKGKTFTFSIKSEIANRMLGIVVLGKRTCGQTYQQATAYGRSVSITIADDFESIGNVDFRWNYNATVFDDTTTTCTEPQFELGEKATEYVPYKGQSVSIATPNGLPGIPINTATNAAIATYTDSSGQKWLCDEIDLASGVYIQRLFTIVLDGTETWVQNTSTGAFNLGAANYSPLGQFAFDTNYVDPFHMCSHFKAVAYNLAANGCVVSFAGGTGTTLSFRYSACADIASWKAYLAAQAVAGTPVTLLLRKSTIVELPLEESTVVPGNPDGNITITSECNMLAEISSVASETTVKSAKEAAEAAQEAAGSAGSAATAAMSNIQQLSTMISTLVTDGNGSSLMTQTADGGWTFSIAAIQEALAAGAIDLEGLAEAIAAAKGDIDKLAESLGITLSYVKITEWNGQPCIELGETDSEFKLRITNTEIQFADGTTIPAYISNKKLMIKQAQVKEELQFGLAGGRNLLLNSGVVVSNNEYRLASYTPVTPLVAGERYTISICFTPAVGVSQLVPFTSAGYNLLFGIAPTGTEKQIVTHTFSASYADGKTPDISPSFADIQIYRFPNDGTVTGNSTIHWIKIEKGETATAWVPAENDGSWLWKRRENGNFGLSWKEGNE